MQRRAASFFGIIGGLVSCCAHAGPVRAGRIESITSNHGAVFVQRGAQRLSAVSDMTLYPGDRLSISADATICINTPAQTCLSQTDNNFAIKAAVTGEHSAMGEEIWQTIFGRADVHAQGQATATNSRGGNAGRVAAASLLPAGEGQVQRMPAGYRAISPMIAGSIEKTRWVASSGIAASYDLHSTLLEFASPVSEAQDIRLQMPTGSEIALWHVTIDNAPPRPAWLPATALDQPQRLERAAWILREGPADWRLFALSDLATMAKAGYFEADEILSVAYSESCMRDDRHDCPLLDR